MTCCTMSAAASKPSSARRITAAEPSHVAGSALADSSGLAIVVPRIRSAATLHAHFAIHPGCALAGLNERSVARCGIISSFRNRSIIFSPS